MHLETSSAKWHPFCLGLNVLMDKQIEKIHNYDMNNVTVSGNINVHD